MLGIDGRVVNAEILSTFRTEIYRGKDGKIAERLARKYLAEFIVRECIVLIVETNRKGYSILGN